MGAGATTGKPLSVSELDPTQGQQLGFEAHLSKPATSSKSSQLPPSTASDLLGARPPAGSLASIESRAIAAAVAATARGRIEPASDVNLSVGDAVEAPSPLNLFLAESLCGVPYPRPWILEKDPEGVFFVNEETGETALDHPLQGCLSELAEVFRSCWELPPRLRREAVATQRARWEESNNEACQAWYSVTHTDGRVYFCNEKTNETTWEEPLSMILPLHFMRVRAASWLESEAYVAYLTGSASQEQQQQQREQQREQQEQREQQQREQQQEQQRQRSGLPQKHRLQMPTPPTEGGPAAGSAQLVQEEGTPSSSLVSTTPRSVRIACGDASCSSSRLSSSETPISSEVQPMESVGPRPSTMGTLLGRTRATLLAPLDVKRRFSQYQCRDRRVTPFPDEGTACPV